MIKSELLAPAKNKETAIAAIDAGADAIYIGANSFGARKNASNSLNDIKEVVDYAHKFWAKVFVTVNTILDDNELIEAFNLIKNLDNIGIDAIIIQDMGLLKKCIDEKINLPIHMSTQCDNRDIEKFEFFSRIGVSRVVLARELSLEKIKEIHKRCPNLELEAFVHGALCVSYSGQCYLSEFIGGRSANRGECAQPCRKKYTVETTSGKILAKDIYALSLKDFNASKYIKTMLDNGVFSFKIEGRLKDINYVKNIVAFYRKELDKYSQKISSGKSSYPFEPNPEKSFNRGFTDYFLEKRKDCFNFTSPKSQGEYLGKVIEVKNNYIRINTDKNIHPQDGLVFGDNGFLVNKVEGDKIYPNKQVKIKVGYKIFRNNDVDFEKKLDLPLKRQMGVNITVQNGQIELTDEDDISIVEKIESNEAAKNPEKMKETFIKQISKTGDSDFYIKNIEINSDIPFMPVSEINKLRRELFDKLMQKRVLNYPKEIQKEMKYVDFYKKDLDYRGNVYNKDAQNFYSKCNCKILEPAFEKTRPTRQVEIMRTKHCIKYALGICKSPQEIVLLDEKGIKFPLKFDCKNCEMVILSPIK